MWRGLYIDKLSNLTSDRKATLTINAKESETALQAKLLFHRVVLPFQSTDNGTVTYSPLFPLNDNQF